MEYYQHGILPSTDCWSETLAPGKSAIYSWTDPERTKTKKILCCNLDLINRNQEKLKTMQKLEIELDNLEYRRTFIGQFVDHGVKDLSSSRVSNGISGGLIRRPQAPDIIPSRDEDVSEKIIEIEIITDGWTKTLRLTESGLIVVIFE